MASLDVIVAGHICLDIIPRIPIGDLQSRLEPGVLIEIERAVLSTGGAVSNTGRALHRLGLKTRLMGKVGDDPFGRIVFDLIRQDNPALIENMITAPGEVTSYTLVISPQGVDRAFYAPGAIIPSRRTIRLRARQGCPPVSFFYPICDACMPTAAHSWPDTRRVKTMGVITTLDMAMPIQTGQAGGGLAACAGTHPALCRSFPAQSE
jgi:hypothetical protein